MASDVMKAIGKAADDIEHERAVSDRLAKVAE
jgi:hypothetical protein